MFIGFDFDNTIVCYDGVFHQVALEQGLIPEDLPKSKEKVRDHLRAIGKEDDWTEMQGYVYGMRMNDVTAFPDVLEFMRELNERSIDFCIISHKTKTPYRGPEYDLHAAALGWMESRGLFDKNDIGLPRDRVIFEPTKLDKIARIDAMGCTHFIDDLPEFLGEPSFPQNVERIHFSPVGGATDPRFVTCVSWKEIAGHILGS